MNHEDVDWSQARCAGTDAEMFYYNAHEHEFPLEGDGGGKPYQQVYAYLNQVCSNCPIMVDCYEYALLHEEHGYWGGTSPAQRKQQRAVLGITLQETHNPDVYDEYVLQSRQLQEELLKEESYDTGTDALYSL
jgi:hypothetical protein